MFYSSHLIQTRKFLKRNIYNVCMFSIEQWSGKPIEKAMQKCHWASSQVQVGEYRPAHFGFYIQNVGLLTIFYDRKWSQVLTFCPQVRGWKGSENKHGHSGEFQVWFTESLYMLNFVVSITSVSTPTIHVACISYAVLKPMYTKLHCNPYFRGKISL